MFGYCCICVISLSRHHGSTSATSACSRPLSPGTVASPVISYSQPSPHSLIHSAHQSQPRVSPQPPSPSLHVSLSSANLSLPRPVFISDPPQPISTSPHCGNPLPVSPNLHEPVLGQKHPPVPNDQDPCAFAASMQPSLLAFNQDIAACRSPCTVPGCQARIAPSMWHSHMQQHAHGILSGEVPASWLSKQGLFICPRCRHLVSSSRSLSHQRRCCGNFNAQLPSPSTLPSPSLNSLPTLDEVFSPKCPTIRFVPSKFRHAFARALASTLSNILYNNTVESWLKLFMLPKCVLPSAPRRGRRHHPTDINLLCEAWECGQFTSLWARTKQHVSHHGPWSSPLDEDVKKITEAISLAKDGLLGKACQILTSSGLAPDTEDTWTQLSAKHPKSPPPVPPAHPPLPMTSPILPPDFNVLSIL